MPKKQQPMLRKQFLRCTRAENPGLQHDRHRSPIPAGMDTLTLVKSTARLDPQTYDLDILHLMDELDGSVLLSVPCPGRPRFALEDRPIINTTTKQVVLRSITPCRNPKVLCDVDPWPRARRERRSH